MSTQVTANEVQETNVNTAIPAENAAPVAAQAEQSAGFKAAEAPSINGEIPPETPAFTPNFKFKVLDKELEIDEFMRGVIKDAETEKKVKELYEKAHGIDFVKKERDRVRSEYQAHKTQTDPLLNEIKELGGFLKEKDFDRFFDKFQISEEAIVNWVADKLRYKQMSPEQRAVYDNQRQLKDRVYEQNSAVQSTSNELNQMRIEQTQFYISQIQSDPQVAQMAEKYDSHAGKPGEFWNQALAWADYLCESQGRFVPFNEAFNDYKRNFLFMSEQPQQAAQNTPVPPPQAKPVVTTTPVEKPTIKNFPTSSQSPVKSKVRSLDDLQKRYEQLSGKGVEAGRR